MISCTAITGRRLCHPRARHDNIAEAAKFEHLKITYRTAILLRAEIFRR